MGLPPGRRDGRLRIDLAEIAGGRVLVTVGSGRIELGRTAGQQLRVRWTVPALLPERWHALLHLPGAPGPRVRADGAGLDIRARRARLRIDVPDVADVTVRLGRGEITSWGAGCALTLDTAGRVSCRELTCQTVKATASYANLHFAAVPQQVVVDAAESVLALPSGPYRVTAPPDAEIDVVQAPDGDARITVSGGKTRILAARAPLDLRGELPELEPGEG